MNQIEEIQVFLMAKLLKKHPALADEFNHMIQGLPEKQRGDLYRKIFQINLMQDVDGVVGYLATVQAAEQEALSGLTIYSSNEIIKTPWPDPVWAVAELLPVGLTILAGAPKIGKSWLSLQLAKAVATGEPFLTFQAQKGRVLVCALEDSPQRLKNRINAMGWEDDLEIDFLTLAMLDGLRNGVLENNGELLANTIQQGRYELVVIDTLSRAIPGDQLDVQIMTRELAPLQEMSHRLNCAIMLCDHHRKAGGMEGDAVADILGSTAKGAMADTIWSLYRERGKNGAKLSITGRDVDEQTLQMVFDKETCCWENQGETNSLAITERRQEVLDALAKLGRVQMKDLCTRFNQDKGNMYRRLQDLVAAGLVKRETVKRIVYYELV